MRLQKIATQLLSLYDVSISTVAKVYAKRRSARKELRQTISQYSKLQRQHLIAKTTVLQTGEGYQATRHYRVLSFSECCY